MIVSGEWKLLMYYKANRCDGIRNVLLMDKTILAKTENCVYKQTRDIILTNSRVLLRYVHKRVSTRILVLDTCIMDT